MNKTEDIKKNLITNWMLNINKKSLNINEILDLLEENEQLKYILHIELEREFHRQDIRNEIDFINEQNEYNEHNTPIFVDDLIIEKITDDYENRLDNSEYWRIILKESLKNFNIGEVK